MILSYSVKLKSFNSVQPVYTLFNKTNTEQKQNQQKKDTKPTQHINILKLVFYCFERCSE